METLDRTDILILRELQKNANLTTKELAAKVNLSPSPVFGRPNKDRQRNHGSLQCPTKASQQGI